MEWKSKGTVRVETVPVDSAVNGMVIFVPDNDHSVKNGNNDCAVFFNQNEADNHEDRGRIFGLDTNRGGVLVTVDKKFFQNNPLAAPMLSSAAAKNIKVEIVIDIPKAADNNRKPKLIGIVVPAT